MLNLFVFVYSYTGAMRILVLYVCPVNTASKHSLYNYDILFIDLFSIYTLQSIDLHL